MSTSKILREERALLVSQAQALLRKMPMTPGDRATFDRNMAEADKLRVRIDAIESKSAENVEMREGRISAYDRLGARFESATEREYRSHFERYLRHGEVSDVLVRAKHIAEHRLNETDQAAGSQAISYTAGAAGGYFVPAGFVYDVDVATKYYAPLMDGKVCRILETATGSVLPYPTANDTQHIAASLAENVQAKEDALTMGVVTFGAFKYTSHLIRVSIELLQDSAFDLEDFVKQQFAIRFGRGYEAVFTNGTGVAEPLGFIPAIEESGADEVTAEGSFANSGNNGDTGANSIGYGDLVALEHAVDPTYRRGAKWMMHDTTVQKIKGLLDKFGRPIWLPGIAVNAPDTILGYPYVVNQSMEQVAPSARTIAFGDWQKYVIRKVREMSVLRLNERYADFGQVAFIAFSRVDGRLVDAGTHPLKLLVQQS